jgi:hypothetical protein
MVCSEEATQYIPDWLGGNEVATARGRRFEIGKLPVTQAFRPDEFLRLVTVTAAKGAGGLLWFFPWLARFCPFYTRWPFHSSPDKKVWTTGLTRSREAPRNSVTLQLDMGVADVA